MFNFKESRSLFPAILSVSCLTALTTTSHAALLSSESFEYTGTSLDGANGGTGWDSGWNGSNGTLSGDDTSLTYPDGTGDIGSRINQISGGSISRTMTTGLDLSTDATYYYSFLANKNDGGSFDLFFSDGSNSRLKMRWNSSETVSIGVNSSTSTTVGTYAIDTDLLFVFKVNATTGTDTLSIKIFEPGDEITEPVTWDAVDTRTTGVTVDTFAISSNLTGFQIDAINVGTEFSDVIAIPEPGSLTLLVLGTLSLFKRKTR